MRLFIAVSLCAVLLAAMAAAQTSSTQAPDASQQPQNPLQEPPKATVDAQAPRPKTTGFETGATAGGGQDQDLGEIRLMTRQTELNGDQSRSFRIKGQNNLAEVNFFSDHRFLVNHRIQVLSMYRGTDDRSIDPEHNSLQKAFVRIYGPRDEYILGDALVNYSRMSFNQNIKGLSTAWKLGENWKVSTVGGVFIDRYGSLYNDLPGRPYTAAVFGGRVERKVARDSFVGLNFSSSQDQIGSLPPATVGSSPQPAANRVGAMDGKFQFMGVRVESELAYSFTDFDLRGNAGCPTAAGVAECDSRVPNPELGMQGDWGARLDGSWRHKKLSLRGSFVRFQPNFASMNARQISDLQDVVFRTSYELTDWLTMDGTMRRSNDNLRDQKITTGGYQTTLWGPEARLVFHELAFYPRGVFEVGYRHRIVDGSSPLAVPNCATGASGSTCVDRYVRTPFAEFTIPYKTTFFSIGYERRQAVDLLQPSQTSNTDRIYLSLRGIYDLASWHINPTFRFELERESHRPRLAATPLDPTLDRDTNRLGTAALFVEAPKWFVAELGFRNSSATIFGPTGYSRPSYRAALTYKFMNDENKLIILSFERNNNFYFTSPNFDERVVGVTVVYKFGKRGR